MLAREALVKDIIYVSVGVVLALGLGFAQAQGYPSKPIRLIAPFAPGGSTDLIARLFSQKLSENLGQQVIVDNRGGAGGTIGTEAVAKATPDGYMLVLGHIGTFGVNPTLYPKLSYDVIRDFVPISLLATIPYGMVVHPSLPVRNVKAFIALARARPKGLLYGSGGAGGASHLAGAYFGLLAKIDIVHVPYKGAGPALIDLLAGQTSLMITGLPPLIPHIKAGKLRGLGIGSAQRLMIMPELPTIAESVSGYEATQWYGILAPTGTPGEVVARLNAAIVKSFGQADVKERLAMDGAESLTSTPGQFGQYIKTEIKRWAPVVKATAQEN